MILKLSFGKAIIAENIIEIIVDEGQVFDEVNLQELLEIYNTYFHDKKFGYISNRKNSYSIDLSPGLYTSVHKNMVALAVVCYTQISEQTAQFEKRFYRDFPFQVFRNLEEAKKWMQSYL